MMPEALIAGLSCELEVRQDDDRYGRQGGAAFQFLKHLLAISPKRAEARQQVTKLAMSFELFPSNSCTFARSVISAKQQRQSPLCSQKAHRKPCREAIPQSNFHLHCNTNPTTPSSDTKEKTLIVSLTSTTVAFIAAAMTNFLSWWKGQGEGGESKAGRVALVPRTGKLRLDAGAVSCATSSACRTRKLCDAQLCEAWTCQGAVSYWRPP